MRCEPVRFQTILRLASVASAVVLASCVAAEDRPSAASKDSEDAAAGAAGSVAGIADVLGCLARRWLDGGEQDGRCGDDALFSWFPKVAAEDPIPDDDYAITGERKKKWNEHTLLIGAGAKLILLLPILAILLGKAVSLSLTSLLITSLVFLYKAQSD